MAEEREGETRLLALCESCGAAAAAVELTDGTIQPLGSRHGCRECGGTEFTPF